MPPFLFLIGATAFPPGLQSRQNHFPLGAAVNSAHSKWNHSLGQNYN